MQSTYIHIEGYNISRLDRNWNENGHLKLGGGVCIYIKKKIIVIMPYHT